MLEKGMWGEIAPTFVVEMFLDSSRRQKDHVDSRF